MIMNEKNPVTHNKVTGFFLYLPTKNIISLCINSHSPTNIEK